MTEVTGARMKSSWISTSSPSAPGWWLCAHLWWPGHCPERLGTCLLKHQPRCLHGSTQGAGSCAWQSHDMITDRLDGITLPGQVPPGPGLPSHPATEVKLNSYSTCDPADRHTSLPFAALMVPCRRLVRLCVFAAQPVL